MNKTNQLVKKIFESNSKIYHAFDKAVITALDFKKHGFNHDLKEWEGKTTLDWRMSNREFVFNDFFEKLIEIEPLFKNTSEIFRKHLQLSFFSKFKNFFLKSELYVDIKMVNWILIYMDFRGFSNIKKKHYTKDDILLIQKLDIDYFKAVNLVGKMCPNIYKDYDNALRKEDPTFYYKLNPNKES